MARHVGYVSTRRFEGDVGAFLVPGFVIKRSYKCPDGTLPRRRMTFRRNVEYPTYEQIVDQKDPFVISQSGWTTFGFPIVAAALVGLVIIIGAANRLPAQVIGLLVLWLGVGTPIWVYIRFLRWWIHVVIITEASIDFYWGLIRPKHRNWSAESIKEVDDRYRGDMSGMRDYRKEHFFRWTIAWFGSLFWRILLIGTVTLFEERRRPIVIIPNVPNPGELNIRIFKQITSANERDTAQIRRNTAATAAAAQRQAEIAVLRFVRELRIDGMPESQIAQMLGLTLEALEAIPR